MRKGQKPTCVLTLFVLTLFSLFTGCSSFVADREQGFNMIQRGFSGLDPVPGLYKELELEHVKVIIVGNREQFQWKKAAAKDSNILGYATPTNEIWIFGKMINGQIIVNEAVIGHELTHLLNFADPDIANPDDFRDLHNARHLNLVKR